MNVGQDVRERRHAKGLTQGQLSRLAEMDTPRLSEIERGVTTDPRASTLTKLYHALGVVLPWDTEGEATGPYLRSRRNLALMEVA
jgi:transcriptional regulator with XRE-family HTH domain